MNGIKLPIGQLSPANHWMVEVLITKSRKFKQKRLPVGQPFGMVVVILERLPVYQWDEVNILDGKIDRYSLNWVR